VSRLAGYGPGKRFTGTVLRFLFFVKERVMKKVIYLFIVLLLVASTANAGITAGSLWDGGGATTSWDDGANWDTGSVPTSSDQAVLNYTHTTTIDSSVSASALGLHVGDYDWDLNPVVNMTGGSLDVGSGLNSFWGLTIAYGGETTGTFNLSGGNVHVTGNSFVGGWGVGSLNIDDGNYNVDGALVVAEGSSAAGSVINLEGGTVQTGTFNIKQGGQMNFHEGATLKIWDDARDWIINLENAGLINAIGADGSAGTIEMDYNNLNPGYTTAWVVPEPATMALLISGSLMMLRRKK
jgi:hypothetical protein